MAMQESELKELQEMINDFLDYMKDVNKRLSDGVKDIDGYRDDIRRHENIIKKNPNPDAGQNAKEMEAVKKAKEELTSLGEQYKAEHDAVKENMKSMEAIGAIIEVVLQSDGATQFLLDNLKMKNENENYSDFVTRVYKNTEPDFIEEVISDMEKELKDFEEKYSEDAIIVKIERENEDEKEENVVQESRAQEKVEEKVAPAAEMNKQEKAANRVEEMKAKMTNGVTGVLNQINEVKKIQSQFAQQFNMINDLQKLGYEKNVMLDQIKAMNDKINQIIKLEEKFKLYEKKLNGDQPSNMHQMMIINNEIRELEDKVSSLQQSWSRRGKLINDSNTLIAIHNDSFYTPILNRDKPNASSNLTQTPPVSIDAVPKTATSTATSTATEESKSRTEQTQPQQTQTRQNTILTTPVSSASASIRHQELSVNDRFALAVNETIALGDKLLNDPNSGLGIVKKNKIRTELETVKQIQHDITTKSRKPTSEELLKHIDTIKKAHDNVKKVQDEINNPKEVRNSSAIRKRF